ncbi:hypothetical protein Ddc_15004 [Ditylenchus destructor]|nr:hypothetical protein Ddc_15004 [Ditylenchus destructor]
MYYPYNLLLLAIAVILPTTIQSLTCNICAENNLDEFGECSTPFQYDCSSYEKRYPNEKVFCRTTRHRSNNGTYTIVKECIAESAHYNTFPQKNNQLEEECDVVDIDGFEVAYCLCRNEPLCNQAPIVDQFTAFETKHPEFFDTAPEPNTGSETRTFEPREESHATVTTPSWGGSSPRTAFVEGNQARSQSGFGIDPRSRPSFNNEHGSAGEEQSDEARDEEEQLKKAAEEELRSVSRTTDRPLLQTSAWNAPANNIPSPFTISQRGSTPPQHPFATIAPESAFLPTSTKQNPLTSELGPRKTLSCMQCSQAGLADSSVDCSPQIVVDCPDESLSLATSGRQLCFSRQIITDKGQFGVEKMCVPETAILEEFGKNAVLDGCNSVESGSTISNYCVCSNSQCNRASVVEQMVAQKGGAGNDILSKPLPGTFGTNHKGKQPLFSSANGLSRPETDSLSCMTCLDSELKDAMADCRQQSVSKCPRADSNQKFYCLTRQTHNGKGSFIVEKKCVDKSQFHRDFPEEEKYTGTGDVQSRCASTYDGYVNFCICDSNQCNLESVPKQAEKMTSKIASSTPPLVVFGESSRSQNNKIVPTPTSRPQVTTSPMSFIPEEEDELFGNSGLKIKNDRTYVSTTTASSGQGSRQTSGSLSTTTSSSVKERLERWKAASSQNDSSGSISHKPFYNFLSTIFVAVLVMKIVELKLL